MFEYTQRILGLELQRLKLLDPDPAKTKQIKDIIKILRDGQGYLTKDGHKKVIFFKEL